MFTAAALKWYETSNNHKPRRKSFHRSPFLPSWNLYKVECFLLLYHTWMIFQVRNVHESASLFNLKEKTVMINSRIRSCDTEDPVQVYHANLQTTGD